MNLPNSPVPASRKTPGFPQFALKLKGCGRRLAEGFVFKDVHSRNGFLLFNFTK